MAETHGFGDADMDKNFYDIALKAMFAMALLTFIPAMFIKAPYGRHSRPGWGPSISPPLAWFLMESPTLWISALIFPYGRMCSNPASIMLLLIFLTHYIHRCCIYPLRLKTSRKPVPLIIAGMAFFYNTYNTYLQTRWISHYGNYTTHWLTSPVFIVGLFVFITGMVINVWADSILISLRRGPGDEGYKIPTGGLFEYVSCPNYLGEMIEWVGWAILTWSVAGLSFFLYTVANLGPRAAAHHGWYLKRFPDDYPRSRRVLIPFVY
eukprot:Gb_09142 [translate_table: standard]